MVRANNIRTQEKPQVHETDDNHEHECPNDAAEIGSCAERGDVEGVKDVVELDISTCGQKRASSDANIGNRRKGIERRQQAHERRMARKKHKKTFRQPPAESSDESSSESEVDYEDNVSMSHNLGDANDSDPHHQDQEGSKDVLDNSQDIERMRRRRKRVASRMAKGQNANRQRDRRAFSKLPSSASRPQLSTPTGQPSTPC
ncbi:hypothetical protein FGB62_29g218 [Gracilaria domingensis]|nr:hypothetical protein FGB62_29g218 [Gracilaria domingensis]